MSEAKKITENLKEMPVLLAAIIINVVISLYGFSSLENMNFLAISNTSFENPWQLWTHSFGHVNIFHLLMNLYVLVQYAPIVLKRHSAKVQVFVLFGLPLAIGLIMQIIFLYAPSNAIGYSGVVCALIGFFLQQKQPGSVSVIMQLALFHAMIIVVDLPISITGHAAGFIAGYIMSYLLSVKIRANKTIS
jgi:membrane associated rhomboid family serine protease